SSEWNEMTSRAVKAVKRNYLISVNSAFSESSLVKVLSIARPKHFPEPEWIELESKANKEYVATREKQWMSWDDALIRLQETKPSKVSESAWFELQEFWKDKYYRKAMRDLEQRHDSVKLEELNLTVLDEDQKRSVKERVESKERL